MLATKPIVKTLAEHRALSEAAAAANVLVCVEVHKRFDPIYVDAKDRIQVGCVLLQLVLLLLLLL